MKNYLQLRKEELKKRGAKGFTLMEMLIVVAIIAVLIAIAIPIFTSQLEKSREATDLANVRSAYAVVMAASLTDESSITKTSDDITYEVSGTSNARTYTATIKLHQAENGWKTDGALKAVAGITATGDPTANGTATLTMTQATGAITLAYA